MPTEPDELELQRNGDRIMDRRLTILETRFDTVLPTLATKADLAELRADVRVELAQMRAEIRAESARIAKWMATLAVTMFLGFGGMFFTMMSLFQR
ncbi:MAG TPA: hypothetical protein VF861_06520 [Telluria sp.]